MEINISAKSNTINEVECVRIARQVIGHYDVPIFTKEIVVEEGSVPHSHPVLTLNTKSKDPLVIFKTLLHEQLHWFVQQQSQYQEAIYYLKQNYKDNGEHNKSGTYPNSFWEHLIVCFNTRNILVEVFSVDEIEHVYNQWQAYPETEAFVVDNFSKLKNDLEKFGMIYVKGV